MLLPAVSASGFRCFLLVELLDSSLSLTFPPFVSPTSSQSQVGEVTSPEKLLEAANSIQGTVSFLEVCIQNAYVFSHGNVTSDFDCA